MACRYGIGESGIVWEVTLTTVNDAGETVPYTSADTPSVEFRRPDGTMVRRPAEYANGRLTYDQLDDTELLNMAGEWALRGVLTTAGGGEIKSPWAAVFWVGP